MPLTIKQAVAVFAANLKRAREAADLSQQELGRRTGMSQGQISALEHGRSQPTLATICRFSAVLGIEPSELLRK